MSNPSKLKKHNRTSTKSKTKSNKGNLCRHLVAASKNFPNSLAVSVQKKKLKGLTKLVLFQS